MQSETQTKPKDVLIVGGGPAGLSAALYLGRARRSALVIDHGNPRHGVAEGVHNFLTREGFPPAALRATAWEQMAQFPSIERQTSTLVRLERHAEQWRGYTATGQVISARTVLLATGVVDEHLNIPGYPERWGRSINHCPFCHGWEVRDRPLAVLAHGAIAEQFVPILRNWSQDLVLLTHGQELAPELREKFAAQNIPIYQSPLVALEGPGDQLERIRLADGSVLARQGLFVKLGQHQVELVKSLDLRFDEHGYVEVDPFGTTSLPLLWAAGDLTSGYQQVLDAAAQGARAAVAIIKALVLA